MQRCPRYNDKKNWIARREKRKCSSCKYEWRINPMPLRLSCAEWKRLLMWFMFGHSQQLYRNSSQRICSSADETRSREYSEGEDNHINGLEGFWGYLKRMLASKGGIRRERLYIYLAEYVWRHNHRRLKIGDQSEIVLSLIQNSSTETLPIPNAKTTCMGSMSFAREKYHDTFWGCHSEPRRYPDSK